MNVRITRLLSSHAVDVVARIMLTMPFWSSGLAKAMAFNSGVEEMTRAGLEPGVAYNLATIVTQLIGSALVISGHRTWLGAGALGIFTALTIPLVHRFWAITDEPLHTFALHTAIGHLGLIGGLIGIAALSARERQDPSLRRHGAGAPRQDRRRREPAA